MNAIILSIGDELILGQSVDTNSAWLSQQLAAVGIDVIEHRTVADDRAGIAAALRDEFGRCDWLIVSGGLGPTEDDLTRVALADAMQTEVRLDEKSLEQIQAFFRRMNRPMAAINRVQAYLPRGSEPVENFNGTAPGMRAVIAAEPGKKQTRVFVMPGVPKEMKAMFTRSLLPEMQQAAGGATILSATLHTIGMGESNVGQKLGELMDRRRNPSVGTTVSGGVVSLRINSRFSTRAEAQQQLDATIAACRSVLGDLIYGRDEETPASVVGKLLTERSKTVATAESCTGGLIAKMLTDIAGSSRYFQCGWVTYSNIAKTEMLGVDPALIQAHGAVSESVVAAMAEGARRSAKADYALSISGIAGPDGGTPEKPVGTVCIGLASATRTVTRTIRTPGDREMIRERTAKLALAILRCELLGIAVPF